MNDWHFREEYLVSSTDTDSTYEYRPSGLFVLLQKTIAGHAKLLGLNRDDALANYNCYWMVLRIFVRMTRPVIWGETVTAVSVLRHPTGTRAYWDCDFYVGQEHVGEATTIWVMANRKTKKPIHLENLPEFPETDPEGAKSTILTRIQFPEGMELQDKRKLYYSDTDINNHISNTRYVDLACDAAELHLRPQGVFLQEITMSYVDECFAGEEISIYRGKADGYIFIHGVGPDGSDRFDCKIKMSSDEGL
jgi:acyl-ACP thioesterase